MSLNSTATNPIIFSSDSQTIGDNSLDAAASLSRPSVVPQAVADSGDVDNNQRHVAVGDAAYHVALRVRNLDGPIINNRRLFTDISVTCATGTTTFITGPSGCGK
jgi:ABC-type uncharacterized transport system fused permease/ATPase subunit